MAQKTRKVLIEELATSMQANEMLEIERDSAVKLRETLRERLNERQKEAVQLKIDIQALMLKVGMLTLELDKKGGI